MIRELILEVSKNDILKEVDPNFINHDKYTKDLKGKVGKPSLKSKNFYLDRVRGFTLYFKIRSAKTKEMYDNIISYTDFYNWLRDNFKFGEYDIRDEIDQEDMVNDLKDYLNDMFENEDVLLGCSCKSWKMWGYQFQGTQIDYGLRNSKENRFPVVRNPGLRGSVCKHLHTTLDYISKKEIKDKIIKLLINKFLSSEIKRRYKNFENEFWNKYI